MDADSRYVAEMPLPAFDTRRSRGTITYAVFRVPAPNTSTFSTHLWKESDRWDLLAATYLGNVTLWHVLVDMNPHIQDPHSVDPGTVIRIPRDAT